jgi:lipopolysaccharide/colanic/teichoic acid biosynthesis glycosyltransferase
MLDDHDRRSSDLPVAGHPGIPAQRRSSDVVGPITLGRPRWQRRHARAVLAVDTAAVGCIPILYLLWRMVTPFPAVLAALTALTAVALSVTGRGALRAWLHRLRRHQRAMSTMLAVGTEADIAALVERTRCSPSLAWRIEGACTPTGTGPDGAPSIAGVPVVGDLDSVVSVALTHRVDAVAAGPAPGWTVVRLARLARNLDRSRTALLVDPRLMNHAGPWARLRRVPGLPLLRLEHPTLRGSHRLAKEVLDRLVTTVLLVVLAPVLVGCALALRLEGHAALRREVRIGRDGRQFSLLTFRCTDPATDRVTPVGRLLSRWCLDELPQLFNVLGGSMSLVGLRPMSPVDVVAAPAQRNLLMKPGMTGLWQLIGDEVPDEQVASVDLSYAERWTPALDAWILFRTVRTVWGSASQR